MNTMEYKTKETYETPAMLEVELNVAGIVCQSGGLRNYDRQDYEEWE